MMVVRRVARPLLASIFVAGGLDAFRNPGAKVPAAEKLLGDSAAGLPGVANTDQLVRADGLLKLLAGICLGLGKFPRLASLTLVGSLVPTTLAGHRFWEEEDVSKRSAQRLQFVKNASILGGVLLAAVDTEARPSLTWRARRAARRLGSTVESSMHSLAETTHTG
jgi:putative oxidoreductase